MRGSEDESAAEMGRRWLELNEKRAVKMEMLESKRAVRAANRLFDQQHAYYKRLRESEEGRQAIIAAMTNPDHQVRLAAATYSLLWTPREAEATLRSLAEDAEASFDVRVNAETALELWQSGDLVVNLS